MALAIKESLLPQNAAIDTGVFMRGVLGHRPNEDRSVVCVEFCNAMIAAGKTLLVGAPTIAEIARHEGKKVPYTEGIVVVPFDDVAANKLGTEIPMAKLHQAKAEGGRSVTYLKFDAMILACALRSRTKILVTLDTTDHAALAKDLPITIRAPEHFLDKQTVLSIVTDPGKPAAAKTARKKPRRAK